MKQFTSEEIDHLLAELNSKNKNKRALAASQLGKATVSYDVIITALQKRITLEQDDLVKGIAKSSIQSLIDVKILHELQSEDPKVKGSALATINDERLKNKHIVLTLEQIVATGDDELKSQVQEILLKRRPELTESKHLEPIQRSASASDVSSNNQLMVLITLPVITIMFIVLGLIIAAILEFENIFVCGVISAVIGFIVASRYLYSEYETRCPSCGLWGAKVEQENKREKLDSTTGYKTVTRTDEIKDSRGEKIAETTRKEQVRVLRTTYLHYYQCRNCNYEWSGTSTHETENFSER